MTHFKLHCGGAFKQDNHNEVHFIKNHAKLTRLFLAMNECLTSYKFYFCAKNETGICRVFSFFLRHSSLAAVGMSNLV